METEREGQERRQGQNIVQEILICSLVLTQTCHLYNNMTGYIV